ncbi:MAG: peptide chain release factor 1 [Patescibacteria group bacterium]|nr:peptide chain release factor 1 [Patescibacteria group bacterium]
MNNPQIDIYKEEYAAIESELSDSAVFSNPQKATKLSRRKNELFEVIEQSKKLVNLQKQFVENEELIASSDDKDFIQMARDENDAVRKKIAKTEKKLNILLLPKDPNNRKDVIVEIRAGAGGDEASLFAANLYRMYSRYAEENGWAVHILSSHQKDLGGFKEIIFEISGKDVFSKMKYESGVHRVQRIPETEKQERIHTSTATVAVLPQAEEIEIEIDPNDLRIDTFASSGPGGQSVNTTNSAVRITHVPANLIVTCQDEKSQHKNKDKALKVLRSRLLALKEDEEQEKQGIQRKSQIGTGDRSEKIRTYNYPQDRITDHRIKQSWSNTENILNGNVGIVIEKLITEDQKRMLQQ